MQRLLRFSFVNVCVFCGRANAVEQENIQLNNKVKESRKKSEDFSGKDEIYL